MKLIYSKKSRSRLPDSHPSSQDILGHCANCWLPSGDSIPTIDHEVVLFAVKRGLVQFFTSSKGTHQTTTNSWVEGTEEGLVDECSRTTTMGTDVKTLVPGSELFQRTYADIAGTLVSLPYISLRSTRLAECTIALRIDDSGIACRATG